MSENHVSLLRFSQMHLTAALATLTECGVLDKIPQEGNIGSKELAEGVDLDESVVRKMWQSI